MDKWIDKLLKSLCLFPNWFLDFPLQDRLNIDFIGFPDSKAKEKSLSMEIIEFLKINKKPVVFTPGTAAKDIDKFFKEAEITLERLQKPGIFLTKFGDKIPGKLPDNIIHVDFAPLELLLEHCSVLVHHGGIGTCFQALKSGIPQIICYRMGEQMENARVIKTMGVCEAMPYKDISSNLLLRYVESLLNKKDISLKCAEIKERLDSNSSEDNLLAVLKEYLSDIG